MTVHNVLNASQLQAALASAVGGDKIIVAAGNYGSVSISNRNYASNVTIQAATFSNPAHFDGLFVSNSKNLTFSGLDLGRTLGPAEPEYTQLNWVSNSSNIKFSGVTIHGSRDNDPTNDGVGLQLTNVTNFNINNSKFTELYRGVAMQKSANVTIQSSDFTTIRSDGVVVAAVDGIVLDKNLFSDFRPIIPDHADAIQFWNTGQTKGSSNITIKNNVLMQGGFSGVEGTGVQGIFISDPLQYGFKNVLIQNNLMYSNGAYNGITVVGGAGVQILGNTVVSKTTDNKQFWIRLEDTDSINLQGNLFDNFITKNVTKLFQANNTNLLLNPGARAEIADLDNAHNSSDLHLANVGYQNPVSPPPSAISSAIGNSIGDMLGAQGGSSLSKTLDMSGLKSALLAAQPVNDATSTVLPDAAELFAPAPIQHTPSHDFVPGAVLFASFVDPVNYFVALP